MSVLSFQRKQHEDNDTGAKWKILQDDYMMGASMKDWDKEDSSGDEGEAMDADVLSDDD